MHGNSFKYKLLKMLLFKKTYVYITKTMCNWRKRKVWNSFIEVQWSCLMIEFILNPFRLTPSFWRLLCSTKQWMTSWLYNRFHSIYLFLRYRNTIDFLIKLVYSSLKFIFNFLLLFFVHKHESTISTQLIKSEMKNKYMNAFYSMLFG